MSVFFSLHNSGGNLPGDILQSEFARREWLPIVHSKKDATRSVLFHCVCIQAFVPSPSVLSCREQLPFMTNCNEKKFGINWVQVTTSGDPDT